MSVQQSTAAQKPAFRDVRVWFAGGSLALAIASLTYTYVHNQTAKTAQDFLQADLDSARKELVEQNKVIEARQATIDAKQQTITSLSAQAAALQAQAEALKQTENQALATQEALKKRVEELDRRITPLYSSFDEMASKLLSSPNVSAKADEGDVIATQKILDERKALIEELDKDGADLRTVKDLLTQHFDGIDSIMSNPPIDRKKLADQLNALRQRWPLIRKEVGDKINETLSRLGCRGTA